MKGLEPPRREPQEPKSCVSTSSTTSAAISLYQNAFNLTTPEESLLDFGKYANFYSQNHAHINSSRSYKRDML